MTIIQKKFSEFIFNTALLVLQNKQIHIKNKFAKLFLNDSHRFVRFKAKEIST